MPNINADITVGLREDAIGSPDCGQSGLDSKGDSVIDGDVGFDADRNCEADAMTGASPGTAQACNELGLNDLESNLARFGIKPPGVS
jgi:hypothetical protein